MPYIDLQAVDNLGIDVTFRGSQAVSHFIMATGEVGDLVATSHCVAV